ncbi:MAG: hypothetical protein Q7T57_02770 [Dehalococcoidales bacterium]|nr:hypothetical protein [Dehalococcoidales bacterium]
MIELRPYQTFFDVYPHPRVLLPNYWVRFSDKFPAALDFVKGRTFRVDRQAQVTFKLAKRIKAGCYLDLNLSDEDTGEKLYPYAQDIFYEVLIGLTPGQWFIIPYFPADQPIYRLDYPTMTPLVSSGKLMYLGNITPEDSPPGNENFKLYLMYQLKPIILRLVVDNPVDYELCGLHFTVNRCRINEEAPPSGVSPKPIYYLDEIKEL